MTNTQKARIQRTILFEWIMSIEGGFVNHPHDRGGKTKFGISQHAHPDIDIATLTIEQAQDIYLADYWHANQCGEMPLPVGFALFDAAVNHGNTQAVKMLQQALGVTQDGIVGPITLQKTYLVNYAKIVHDLSVIRARFYYALVRSDSTQEHFLNGWNSRLFRLNNFINNHNMLTGPSYA